MNLSPEVITNMEAAILQSELLKGVRKTNSDELIISEDLQTRFSMEQQNGRGKRTNDSYNPRLSPTENLKAFLERNVNVDVDIVYISPKRFQLSAYITAKTKCTILQNEMYKNVLIS